MTNTDSATDILEFWLGAPARTPEQLIAKFQRWYQGSRELDETIRQRYGALVERALAGELEAWKATAHGRLALIVLLDQFTRNLYRGTARAYAGDEAALPLALDTIEGDAFRFYTIEERLFVIMPLVHAESVAMLSRGVALADEMVVDAAEALRGPWSFGAERVRGYRALIERFGRFPARNAYLGRSSTAAELAYLTEEAQRESPIAASA